MIKKAVFGAGCFWHVQAAFSKLNGVIKATCGYMGGDEEKYPNPTYDQVCCGESGYAEVVEVEYDPSIIAYGQLIEIFWKIHDPTSLNKQGGDVGLQYRSVIFYNDYEQKSIAENSRKLTQDKMNKEIVSEIAIAKTFFRAEDYHQDYIDKHKGTCSL